MSQNLDNMSSQTEANMLQCKVILRHDKLGYIEYNLDLRVSYMVEEYPDLTIREKCSIRNTKILKPSAIILEFLDGRHFKKVAPVLI